MRLLFSIAAIKVATVPRFALWEAYILARVAIARNMLTVAISRSALLASKAGCALFITIARSTLANSVAFRVLVDIISRSVE